MTTIDLIILLHGDSLFIIEDKKGLKLFHFKREEMIKLDKE